MDFVGSTSLSTIIATGTITFLTTAGVWPWIATCAGITLAFFIMEWVIDLGRTPQDHWTFQNPDAHGGSGLTESEWQHRRRQYKQGYRDDL